MFKHFASVGGLTLLSRVSGLLRDIVMAYVLGAGQLADAFLVAFRIPNHFRSIFAEGAFNAAYVPAYARLQITSGPRAAGQFFSQIFTLLLISQALLLGLAWAFMPQVIHFLAPGYANQPAKFALAEAMTRITFPYLACIVMVTLYSATLNANRRFVAAAFTPVLLNVSIALFLGIAFAFPNAGYAASAGVLVAGFAQLAFIAIAARRAGLIEGLARPQWNGELKRFFTVLGPAVIGSAGVQIAIFADTIIASTLGDGAQSSVNYADRLYLLPIGVIGIAAGTVLLPEMSRRIANGDHVGAYERQNLTLAITMALTAPFCVAFLAMPELLLHAAYVRGKFTADNALAASYVLSAYASGLLAVVAIRATVASFQAVGDLRTPMFVSLFAVTINIALKLWLVHPFGVSGLAMATAAGAWINEGLLVILALRAGLMRPDARLLGVLGSAVNASIWLGLLIRLADGLTGQISAHFGIFDALIHVALLTLLGGIVYVGLMLAQLRILKIEMPLPSRFKPATSR